MQEPFKKRFWIQDDFIRVQAKFFSVYDQVVYVTLCCFANKEWITFVGCRKIAKLLNISKDTVNKSIHKLEASRFIRRLDNNKGRPSHIAILNVPSQPILPSTVVGHKENNKELIKESNKTTNKKNVKEIIAKSYYKHFEKQGRPPELHL